MTQDLEEMKKREISLSAILRTLQAREEDCRRSFTAAMGFASEDVVRTIVADWKKIRVERDKVLDELVSLECDMLPLERAAGIYLARVK